MAPLSEETPGRDAGAGHVGALLQASRQRLGEELADVALMLRIRLPYMAAIEGGRYRELPGATYAVGFIRAYAEHLGLDSEEVVRRFKAETLDGGADQKLSFPTPVPETGIPGGAYVFIGLVIAVLAYGSWYVSTTEDGYFAELISPLDERLSTLFTSEKEPAAETAVSGSDTPGEDENSPAMTVANTEPEMEAPRDKNSPPDVADLNPAPASAPEPRPSVPAEAAARQPAAAQDIEPAVADVEPEPEPEPDSTPPPDVLVPTTAMPAAGGRVESAGVTKVVPAPVEAPVTRVAPTVPAARSTPVAKPVPQAAAAPEPTPVTAPMPSAPVAPAAEVTPAPTVIPEFTNVPQQREAASRPTVVFSEPAAPVPAPVTAPPATIDTESAAEAEFVAPDPPAIPAQAETDPEPEVATVSADDSQANTEANGGSRIVINAKNNSWIQVRDDVANQMLITRLLTVGASYEVPNRPGLVLLTGNAGALEILVDGSSVPSIGGNGVVRRGVLLEVDRLKAGTAVTN
ncbi:MAG: DUF4115 domain-containing protein [Rhodospirillales bacterium]|nr:DUF4115 domain-containing protein [Rhodospirillales bacterium]